MNEDQKKDRMMNAAFVRGQKRALMNVASRLENKSESEEYEEGKKVGRDYNSGKQMPDGKSDAWKKGWEDGRYPSEARSKNPFSNGVSRATREISVKLGNALQDHTYSTQGAAEAAKRSLGKDWEVKFDKEKHTYSVVKINNSISQAETTIFSEAGYKIVQYIGDTSGMVTVVTPGGQRICEDNATTARKYIVKCQREEGEYGKGTKVGNATRTMSKTQLRQKIREGWEVVYGDLNTVRNGQYLEMRTSAGKNITVQVEGD